MVPLTPFGKYTLVAELGRGGMAEVFLGFTSGPAGLRKPVVIKRLYTEMQLEERQVQMFLDEARLAARLNHPHVVQTHDVGEVDDHFFITMEYLEGQPLDRLLRACARRRVRMPPPLAIRIAVDALEGLQYAHELADYDGTPLGVVHRDISPQNIFICYDGTVKVLDFGIAKAATQVVETRTGAIKGKYAYIAPEQINLRPIDRRADLWAMGVVLWEALAGRRLFRARSDLATLQAALNGPIPRLSEVISEAPPAVERAVQKALSRDPAQRYATALEMKQDLEAYLHDLGASVGRVELSRYIRGAFKDVIDEHRQLLSACAQTMSRAQARNAAGSPRAGKPPRSPLPPSIVRAHPARPRRALPLLALAAVAVAGVLGVAFALRGGGGSTPVEPGESPMHMATAPTASGVVDGPAAEPTSVAGREEPPDSATGQGAGLDAGAPKAAAGPGELRDGGRDGGDGGAAVRSHEREIRARLQRRRRAAAIRARRRRAGQGKLTLDTIPWSMVRWRGKSLGITPILEHELPAGTHQLTLRNPEQGIETRVEVRIRKGKTTVHRFGID